ncbi:hypothetical protein ACFXHA_43975 [Nocardia sp. NPDC059240]|uniref:hypothetical protein n=1 Tax=Nocardia sp. NPDC059240 TaxID=3346786 RepID=UPI003692B367
MDDLTLYAAVALANTQPDRDRALHQLAQSVDGWGRIHAVERLDGTQNPKIKAWLLREGFRNGVMYEYLAHIAATTGGLYEALLESEIDAELLDGAAEIISSLVSWGGPAADIRHYPDALAVVDRFGELLESAPPTLARIGTAHRLKWLLHKRLPPELEWPPADVSRLLDRFSALLTRPDWSDHVRSILAGPDSDQEFNRALGCADYVGVDGYSQAMARIQRPPHSLYAWAWVSKRTPEPELADLAWLAGRSLPLAELACGPEPGGAPLGRSEEHILESVLSRLGPAAAAPARPLIRTAIRSAGTRMRRIGMEAADRIFGPDLPADVRDWIGEAAIAEPDDELRGKLVKLFERAPLDLDE